MKLFHLIIWTVIFLGFAFPVVAEPSKLLVNVIVWGNETNAVASYAKRELRDLKDVEIVDDDTPYCYQISICTRQLATRPAHYVVFANFLYQQEPTNCSLFLSSMMNDSSDLKSLVEGAVTQFDTMELEPARERHRVKPQKTFTFEEATQGMTAAQFLDSTNKIPIWAQTTAEPSTNSKPWETFTNQTTSHP